MRKTGPVRLTGNASLCEPQFSTDTFSSLRMSRAPMYPCSLMNQGLGKALIKALAIFSDEVILLEAER